MLTKYPPSLKILSFASQNISENKLEYFKYSLNQLGYDYEILGRSTAWKDYTVKTQAVYNRLHEIDHQYVAIVDNTDVFFVAPPQELYDKISQVHAHDSRVVMIGGEYATFYQTGGKHPESEIRKYFDEYSTEPARYPNGGFLVGSRLSLIELLKGTIDYIDDQAGYYDTIFEKRYPLIVDYRCRFVGNIPNVTERISRYYEYHADCNRYQNIRTKEYPVAFHFSGGNFRDMERLYQRVFFGKDIPEQDDTNYLILIVPIIIVLLIVILIIWRLMK